MVQAPPAPALLGDDALRERIRAFVEPRARAVDANEATLRDGLAFLNEVGALDIGVYERDPAEAFERLCEVTATIAQFDMSQAFALWCHRMGIEYLNRAPAGSWLQTELLPELLSGERLGSTAFAAGTANYLAGTPLPVTFRRDGDDLIANGRIVWASNLEAPFVSVTAGVNAEDANDRLVFAFTEREGADIPPSPDLLALQATASSSAEFHDTRIPARQIVTTDFEGFVRCVLPTFLAVQSSFCWGLASRSLAEAEAGLVGQREILRPDLDALTARARAAEAELRACARSSDRAALAAHDLLALRLEWGTLCVQAVALEAKTAGGRGYMRDSDTARRFREAAFLPVQAPTEVQLRWLLSRSD